MFYSIDLNRWSILIIMIFGLVTNSINMFIFTRPVFNHHVCSWYFFTLALNNLIYSSIVLLYRLLVEGFQIEYLLQSISFCRAVSFLSVFSRGFSHYLILLATIDRFCANSANVQRRKFNSFNVIPWAILSVFLFFSIFAIGAPFTVDLTSNFGFVCFVNFTTNFNKFYLIMQLILFVIFSPLAMILFGFLTLRNRRLMGELPLTVSRCRRMEFNLTGTILLLLPLHLILNFTEIFHFILIFLPHKFPSVYFIETIVRLPIFMSYTTPIVCYLIRSREYRRALNKILPCRYPQIDILGQREREEKRDGLPDPSLTK